MIIWLASYPRSGNTLLRIILNHVFGLKTYSLYNDTVGVGADKATTEVVGHAFLPPEWSPNQAQMDKELWLIKTHEVPQDGEKAIYIIRDGREVSVSYLNYLHNYKLQEDISLFSVIIGAVNFGSWSDHVLAWNPMERRKTLLLNFEELVANPGAHIPAIADFIEREPISKSIPTFADLHAINPTFFRSGRRDSWKSVFNQDHHLLFWLLHHDVMIKYGYDNDMPDVFQRGLSPSEQNLMAVVKAGFTSLRQQNEQLKRYREQLKRQDRQLKQQSERLQRQGERLQRQGERLQRQDERLQRQDERLQRQDERLEHLADENRNLNLQLSQLRNSWSWKITGPLRKVGRFLTKLMRSVWRK
jgi:hypothetical protein